MTMLVDAVRPAAETLADAHAAAAGSKRAHFGMLLACAVLLCACIALRARGGGTLWALIACVVAALLTAALLYSRGGQPQHRHGRTLCVLLLVALWASVVGATTFGGAFTITGNGVPRLASPCVPSPWLHLCRHCCAANRRCAARAVARPSALHLY